MIELKNVSFKYANANIGEGMSEEMLKQVQHDGNNQNDENNQDDNTIRHDNVIPDSIRNLRNIKLTFQEGECVLLTGGSGCGKTTILRLINGLIPNFYEGEIKGQVLINGKNVSEQELYETGKIVGSVFQNPRSQFFNVDTNSELAFALENQGKPAEEILRRVEATVEKFSLQPLLNQSLFKLSGGQRQKIACASVAVEEPEIFVLDEPSANLDTPSTNQLKEMIKIWKADGKTIIISEHRISYLWDLADRTVIMNQGEVVRELDRNQMNKMSEAELAEMGLRSCVHRDPVELVSGSVPSVQDSIILKNFTFAYKKGEPVFDIPEMTIPAGEIIAVVGSNGEGKSTFLDCLCGLKKKFKGKMIYGGQTFNNRKRSKSIFMVMQDVNHQLFTESVLDEVLISQEEENEEAAREILKDLDLLDYADRHPMSLSGGQKQRVAVACAVASGREILLFDEPTSGLDYIHMKQICELLKKLKQMGRTVIVVTHDAELIQGCCGYVVRLKK